MLELRKTTPLEIENIVALESANDVVRFILPYSPEKHRRELHKDDVIYLSIFNQNAFSGFIILALDADSTIEFRRIVVNSKGQGIGQAAIKAMELYCKQELKSERIWLDVFASNLRGQHIYEKLGFTKFGTGSVNGETIYFYQKRLT